jgi:hypothetical protein
MVVDIVKYFDDIQFMRGNFKDYDKGSGSLLKTTGGLLKKR